MDNQQALAIVTALANGADPSTGEQFAADSPYQSPNVIRALFAAQHALESQLQGQPKQQSSARPSPSSRSSVDAGKANAGKTWNAEEDKQLLAAFDADKPLAEIARVHGRTIGGVRARLEKHGRLEPSPATRWPAKDIKESAPRYEQDRNRANGGDSPKHS